MSAEEFICAAPRAEQDGRDTIRTYTGLYVRPLALREEDFRLEDIGHHLSNICRYTGACPGFYSVAQHSVMVMKYVRNKFCPTHWHKDLLALALLHDAPEAYLNDIASPVKHTAQMKFYRDIDDSTTRLVAKRFLGLSEERYNFLWKAVKEGDDETFYRETRVFYGKRRSGDWFFRLPPWLAKLEFKYWVWRLGINKVQA